jgi:hypothetical protein
LFSHHDRRGKCEWFEGGLEQFASHYNATLGTDFNRTECLDVVRIGGSTAKQPEVLLTNKANGEQMVIERKSVVWPPDYILRHNNEHLFADTVWNITRGCFGDRCYELLVSGKQMEKLDSKRIKSVATEIGSAIVTMDVSKLPVRRTSPVGWMFRRANVHEHGDRKGIVVIHQDSVEMDDFLDESAKAGTTSQIQKELTAASLKFVEYPRARKLVLLDFFGTKLWEDDIPPLMNEVQIPENIDEIWMSKRDWISEDDFEIGYERLFVR